MAASLATNRYGRPLVALHWLTVLLLIAIYASMELRGYFERGRGVRESTKYWHLILGLSALALAWIRLAVRWFGSTLLPDLRQLLWQRPLASITHVLLHLLMIAMPTLGWWLLSAEAKLIPFFGLELPALVATDAALAERFEDLHVTLATDGYFLIGGHAAVALVHHYLLKDGTLRRMLP